MALPPPKKRRFWHRPDQRPDMTTVDAEAPRPRLLPRTSSLLRIERSHPEYTSAKIAQVWHEGKEMERLVVEENDNKRDAEVEMGVGVNRERGGGIWPRKSFPKRPRRVSFSDVDGRATKATTATAAAAAAAAAFLRAAPTTEAPPVRGKKPQSLHRVEASNTMQAVRLAYSVDSLRNQHAEMRSDVILELEKQKRMMVSTASAIVDAISIIQGGAIALAERDRRIDCALENRALETARANRSLRADASWDGQRDHPLPDAMQRDHDASIDAVWGDENTKHLADSAARYKVKIAAIDASCIEIVDTAVREAEAMLC
jgi:hypothetical protein